MQIKTQQFYRLAEQLLEADATRSLLNGYLKTQEPQTDEEQANATYDFYQGLSAALYLTTKKKYKP